MPPHGYAAQGEFGSFPLGAERDRPKGVPENWKKSREGQPDVSESLAIFYYQYDRRNPPYFSTRPSFIIKALTPSPNHEIREGGRALRPFRRGGVGNGSYGKGIWQGSLFRNLPFGFLRGHFVSQKTPFLRL